MPTTPSSDPHVPYLVSVTATRAELDSLSDAVADAVDGWREDGDARLVLAADRISSLMDRIKRSWRTESTQHAATPPTGQPAPGTWSLSGVDDDTEDTRPIGTWLGDVRTITVTLTEAQRMSLMYALSQEAEHGRDNGDGAYARNLETIAVVVAQAWDWPTRSERF